jgi:hypothetical protein
LDDSIVKQFKVGKAMFGKDKAPNVQSMKIHLAMLDT